MLGIKGAKQLITILGEVVLLSSLILACSRSESENGADSDPVFVAKAEDGDTHTVSTHMVCGAANVEVKTRCLNENLDAGPSCLEQGFNFKNEEKTYSFQTGVGFYGVENDKGETINIIDFLASDWACIKSGDAAYILVGYYNGGNCEECEWYELVTVKGERLSFDPDVAVAKSKFGAVYSGLGFTGWPSEDSFEEIQTEKK